MTSGADVCGEGPRMFGIRTGTFLKYNSTAIADGPRHPFARHLREPSLRNKPAQLRNSSELMRSSAFELFFSGGKSPAAIASRAATSKTRGGCHLADRTFGA